MVELKDLYKVAEANAVIDYVEQQINAYTKNTSVIKYRKSNGEVIVQYRDLKITLSSAPGGYKQYASYFPNRNELILYKAQVAKDPKLSVEFCRKSLLHELIHHFDVTRSYKGNKSLIVPAIRKKHDEEGYEGYINHPLEVNAYFFEHVLDEVFQDLKLYRIALTESTDEFVQRMKQTKGYQKFQEDLTPLNTKKILKRLATIHQNLKKASPQEILSLRKVVVTNTEQESKKFSWLDRAWDTFLFD